jgi:microcin C transport system ATP-binding protein
VGASAGLSPDEREARVIAALKDVGLDPDTRFRYPHEFPAGSASASRWRARSCWSRPSWCSTSRPPALDMLIQTQIVDLLRDLQKRRQPDLPRSSRTICASSRRSRAG